MDRFGFAVIATKADVSSAGLKVSEIAATGNLQPSFLAGSPNLEVELFGVREADISGANQKHAVGKFELLKQSLGVRFEGLQFFEAVVGVRPLD